MEDFSQIIGVIMAIAFFIFSALRKKGKKGDAVKKVDSNILESFFGEEYKTESQEYVPEEKLDFEDYNKVEIEKKGKIEPVALNNQTPVVPKSMNTKKNPKKSRAFDLKSAFIYSEILKRKYL